MQSFANRTDIAYHGSPILVSTNVVVGVRISYLLKCASSILSNWNFPDFLHLRFQTLVLPMALLLQSEI